MRILWVVLMLAACSSQRGSGQQDRLQAAPTPTASRLAQLRTASDTMEVIRRYAAAIPASEFDSAEETSDQRRLMVGNCPEACRFGPFAKIQPRFRSARWDRAHRDSGDIIARILSDGPYRHVRGSDTTHKFNIHGRDTVYWWVGRRGETVVSIFTSTAPGSRPLVSDLTIRPHPAGYWRGLAIARWLWRDRDDIAWGTCDGQTCCRSTGLALQ